ncbi:MAG: RagB/SusD family nutrient uptake outer membrane protein [Porphyromonadaceae bacterium]|nr:MAG: RagB/SusD family nutrient uptake outer membrane protein [Porphyromonadaceae bacterium]
MKNIFKLLIATLLALPFYSCGKINDFLDLKPADNGIAIENTTSTGPTYKTANAVEAALAGVYAGFRNEYFELDYFVNGDAQSDDAYAGADNPANFQIDDYKISPTNSNVKRDWAYLYNIIGQANVVINNVDSVPDTLLTSDRRKEIRGEASFIRAFMYFQLVQLWGDVPLQLKELKTFNAAILPDVYPILFPKRAPMTDVYAQIIIDLETALLNVKATAANKTIITKGAANAMLAKVYATQDPHDWNKVLKYCNDVIAGGYSLLPDYDQLWDNAHENSVEAIFEINYEGTASSGNWGASMFRGLDWKKFNIPSNDLVAAFDAEHDNIRKASSIIFLDVTGKWSDPHWPQTNYPFGNKYRIFTSPSPQNYIFIRLADILLLKAEALNETGDLTGAAALVNQIRTRVSLPNTTAGTQPDMHLAIEKERRLELAFEGVRWYDLKRTGRAIEVMNNVTGVDGVNLGYSIALYQLLWPIPQAELDKNTQLTQNPGY